MRSLSPQRIAVAASLTGWLTPIFTSSPSFAKGQELNVNVTRLFDIFDLFAPRDDIVECPSDRSSECASASNRTCYYHENTDRHECGACLNGFFDFLGTCYDISDIHHDTFAIFSQLIERFLPEYASSNVTTEERAERLRVVMEGVSFWMSRVPPPQFELGLTLETFLTDEERRGRFGINPDLKYDPNNFLDAVNNRGGFGRFEFKRGGRRLGFEATFDGEVPPAVDWAADGYMTTPKNQGLCGCCWAVSVAAAVESALMITGQTSRDDNVGEYGNSLSFQQMVSCDKKELGCDGGNILQATRYVWEHNEFGNSHLGGLLSFEDYPYTDFKGQTTEECKSKEIQATGKSPAAYLNYPKVVNSVNDRSDFNERKERLMAAVAQQPVIATLRSECPLLANYKKGVLTHDRGCECADVDCIDHAIVIVGYDRTASTPFWKLRNSWGIDFGEEGYFKIAMDNPGAGEWGLFGMLSDSAIPSEAYANAEDLPGRPSWWETSTTAQKVLVILFSIIGFCCLCGCVGFILNKFRRSTAPEST